MIGKALIAVTLCVLLHSIQAELTDNKLPAAVVAHFGTRDMRYHHFLWHNVRELWLNLDASTQHAIAGLGWEPPRPSAFFKSDGTQIILEDNDSGEDFLYMHRQMVQEVNRMVAGTDYGKVTGWKRFPPPGHPTWYVPAPYTIPGDAGFTALIADMKSDDFYWGTIAPFEEQITNPDYLRTITLGQLGSKLEYYIHKWMHIRFSEMTAIGVRATDLTNPTPNIDTKWDDLSYRWLGDTYSSHVNPVFWRIHGWVDNMIEEWRKANNLETIEWKGTWVSGPFSVVPDLWVAGAVKDGDNDVDTAPIVDPLHEAAHILLKAGGDGYFRNTPTTSPFN